MAITIGTHLGSHAITALLGRGGMGEVYRARATKLKREVAIKILPDEFLSDPACGAGVVSEIDDLRSVIRKLHGCEAVHVFRRAQRQPAQWRTGRWHS